MNTDETTVASDSEQGATEQATTTTEAAVQASASPEAPQTDSQGPSQEDAFFDPTAIPEELKPAYKQMQAAFTKKTQEIAEQRKQFQELQKKAETFSKYEPYVPVFEEMIAGQQKAQNPEITALEQQLKQAGYSDDAIEMMKLSASFLLNQVNQTREAEKQAEIARQQQERWQAQIKQATALDPRLSDANLTYQTPEGDAISFGQLVEQLAMTQQDWQQDFVTATKKAIALADTIIGQAKVQGKQELSAAAQQKARHFPAQSTSPQSAQSTSTPRTMREAAELARREIGMK